MTSLSVPLTDEVDALAIESLVRTAHSRRRRIASEVGQVLATEQHRI